MTTRKFASSLLASALLVLSLASHAAAGLPGEGVSVQPLQSALAEETFQTLLVSRALTKLGYDVSPINEVEYPTAHIAVANGDATFMANHWNPHHAEFYKNAGGDAKMVRKGVYSAGTVQGYMIDKKTADRYRISRIDQLTDPKLAKLFEVMALPIGDISTQNRRMHDGESRQQDVERHTDGWIKAHQETFDDWIAQAMATAL